MGSHLSRSRTIAAITAAIVLILFAINLPRSPVVLTGPDPSLAARTVRGVIHVHSVRSDGLGDKTEIAGAARSTGLQFVVFTDHGDGTRQPDSPSYIDGVLCIDGVEISTDDGHYAVIGAAASPYPLGGSAASVVEDVARLGGFGVAAHPSSARRDLQWSDWAAPFDALEWLNADSEWRDEGRLALSGSLLGYLMRPSSALARLLDRPTAALARWDELGSARRVLGVAGNDAHGGIGKRIEDAANRWSVRVPSYRASFGTFSTRVLLDAPLEGDAVRDGASLIAGLKAGRFYTEIDALATGALLEFRGRTNVDAAEQGSVLSGSGTASFTARALLPAGGEFVAYRNGAAIARSATSPFEFSASEPGAYRVEAHVPDAPGDPPVPWLVSNPVFRLQPPVAPAPRETSTVRVLRPSWRIEKDPVSVGALQATDDGAEFTFQLRGDRRSSQFVALATDLSDLPEFDALTFSIQSSAPRRLSVQLRFAKDQDARWGKSVYADQSARAASVHVAQLRRADGPQTRPAVQRATSLLFVLDLTNARPGDSGKFVIRDVRLVR